MNIDSICRAFCIVAVVLSFSLFCIGLWEAPQYLRWLIIGAVSFVAATNQLKKIP